MDATKSLSPAYIPSVGLAPIDAKTKGDDSRGDPDSKTAIKLGRLRRLFSVGFGPVDLKPF
jgi:hypothetical protein